METPNSVPRGIELIIARASADPEFRRRWSERPVEAAREIGVELTPEEVAILRATPAAQLDAVIEKSKGKLWSRAAFIGLAGVGVAAAALVLPVLIEGCGGSRPIRPPGYVLYEESDSHGAVSFRVGDEWNFEGERHATERANREREIAFGMALQAWEEDATNKDTPFPMGPPEVLSLHEGRRFSRREEAEAAGREGQKQIEAAAAQARREEETRLAGLSEADRPRELKRAERLKAAQRLFEEKLAARLNAKGPEPPVEASPAKGIRPDRP